MKLLWDQVGERLYETGTDRGVIFPQKVDGTYNNGVAWNGLTGVTLSPSGGDENKIYADNIKYVGLRAAEEFGATIEAYTYPEEFALCDGSAIPAEGVYFGQQKRSPFGFSFRSKIGNDTEFDDHGYKIHLIYNASVSPSEKGYSTINDSPDAITFSWELSTTPVPVSEPGLKPVAHIEIDSTKVDPAKLTALEDLLYGTENAESTLPTPDAVIAMFKGSQSNGGDDNQDDPNQSDG